MGGVQSAKNSQRSQDLALKDKKLEEAIREVEVTPGLAAGCPLFYTEISIKAGSVIAVLITTNIRDNMEYFPLLTFECNL